MWAREKRTHQRGRHAKRGIIRQSRTTGVFTDIDVPGSYYKDVLRRRKR